MVPKELKIWNIEVKFLMLFCSSLSSRAAYLHLQSTAKSEAIPLTT